MEVVGDCRDLRLPVPIRYALQRRNQVRLQALLLVELPTLFCPLAYCNALMRVLHLWEALVC